MQNALTSGVGTNEQVENVYFFIHMQFNLEVI